MTDHAEHTPDYAVDREATLNALAGALQVVNGLRSEGWSEKVVPLIMGVLQLLALVFVFRWWRRRAPEILADAQRPPEPAPGRARRV